MFSEYLEKIENVGVYPAVALVIFFVLFIILLIWVFRMDKRYIQRMKNLPLDKNKNNGKSNGEDKKGY
ncbi:MAG TPA: cbb3-type cytochrome c oxidase subunit 3 [Ignavibacteriales bacterium]|nr:cbb3-type cytochrome c oxidase subunit 3 [Ignavibacteriales bacterium]